MQRQEFKGEITAFLSMVFILSLSLVGALIQSASTYMRGSMKRADTQLALECVFAEYHKELWEKYEILAIVEKSETQIQKRLEFYGASGMSHQMEKHQLLSDGQGRIFYEQAIRSMGKEPNESSLLSENTLEEQQKQSEEELDDILAQEGQEMPKEDNPITSIHELKKSNLLSLVHPNPESLSSKTIATEHLLSHRNLKQGNIPVSEGNSGAVEKALFVSYLMNHFPDYSDKKEEGSLSYEAEYLVGGKGSDQENLEATTKKILTIRTGLNYGYLLTDSVKMAEAEAMALTLSSLLTVPGATAIVKQVLLFSWAYGESVVDMRVLFQGKKVPLVKTADTWQLELANLAKLGRQGEITNEYDGGKGISYAGYVEAFLLSTKQETLQMRALDLIELNLDIKMDGCVTALQIETLYKQPRISKDTFVTSYQYQ